MEKLIIKTGNHSSSILLGESITNLGNYLNHERIIVITDTNVFRLYNRYMNRFPVIVIGTGEGNKSLSSIESVMEKLLEFEADRSTFIIGFGGGIVCDIAGFAASIFMRGLKFGFVSTTLLSQVDASVGGKNGINFKGFKNMIGVFRQPEFVLCDYSLLRSLEKKEFTAGFAEIIKAAAIRDKDLFAYLTKSSDESLAQDPEVIHQLVKNSVKIKTAIVQNDEREKSERRLLNFGHTFGHAIEKLTGMLHGESVSLGMVMAVRLSVKLGMCSLDDANQLIDLLQQYGLPVTVPLKPADIFDAIRKDKKREKDFIHFVLLRKIGDAETRPIPIHDLQTMIHDLC
jgi:3-dehydroquinate synthase